MAHHTGPVASYFDAFLRDAEPVRRVEEPVRARPVVLPDVFVVAFVAFVVFVVFVVFVAFFSLAGHSMFTQILQGPRWVVTSTIGAPQSGQVSPRAWSLPRAGKG
jgi:hypothetical protein